MVFKAVSLTALNEFLDFSLVENFIYDLGSQILSLKEEGRGVLYIGLSDIVIINSNHFLFINPNKLFSIHNGDSQAAISTVNTYSSMDKVFVPPELHKNSDLSKTSWVRGDVGSYYSLAKVILYIFNLTLENLYYTKLYFFLTRCLEPIPNKRVFLYI